MEIQSDFFISAVMAICGLLMHICKKMIQASADDESPIGPVHYFTGHPWQTCLSILGTIAMLLVSYETGTLNAMSAFLAGVAGNSAAETIGSRKA